MKEIIKELDGENLYQVSIFNGDGHYIADDVVLVHNNHIVNALNGETYEELISNPHNLDSNKWYYGLLNSIREFDNDEKYSIEDIENYILQKKSTFFRDRLSIITRRLEKLRYILNYLDLYQILKQDKRNNCTYDYEFHKKYKKCLLNNTK